MKAVPYQLNCAKCKSFLNLCNKANLYKASRPDLRPMISRLFLLLSRYFLKL